MLDFCDNQIEPKAYPASLENLFIETPYSTRGIEYLLPRLDQILRPAVQKASFLDGERPQVLGDWMSFWPTHRRDLYELRQRLRLRNQQALSWLVMFVVDHHLHLSQVAITPPNTLKALWDSYATDIRWTFFMDKAFQRWIVCWLHDALADPSLDQEAAPPVGGGSGSSGETGDGTDPELRPRCPSSDLAPDF